MALADSGPAPKRARTATRGFWSWCVALLALLVPSLLITGSGQASAAGPAFVGDVFDGVVLGSQWSVVDPVGDGSVVLPGSGVVELSVPGGVSHDAWGTNRALRIVQPLADEDFVAQVGFGSVPTAKYQLQGVIVEQDADNYLRFDFHSTGSSLRVFAAETAGGSSSSRFVKTIAAPSGLELYLRVSRAGGVWSLEYSDDAAAWSVAGSFSSGLVPTLIGPFGGNAGASPAFTAVVDSFENVLPGVPADFTLTTDVVGAGSVGVDPDSGTYPAGSEVTLTATPDAGHSFVGWTGDYAGSGNPATITLTGDMSVTATFELDAGPDTVSPVISDVTVSAVTDTSATISWVTDEAATTTLAYGPTAAYENGTIDDAVLSATHSVTLTGLDPDTTYHVQPRSIDASNNATSAPDTTLTTTAVPPPGVPVISLWDGDYQRFGHNGQPQRWINVIGGTTDADGIASMEYTLNGGAPTTVRLGPDLRRLYGTGDFNIQIDYADLLPGNNSLVLTSTDTTGDTAVVTVTIDYVQAQAPTLPYTIDFGSAVDVADVIQVVDGPWELSGGKLKPGVQAYDRLAAIGDMSWQDYEVEVPVTIVGFGDEYQTPQSGNQTLLGLGLRWNGHTQRNGEQAPYTYWYPTGAFAWYQWFNSAPGWKLFGNSGSPKDNSTADAPGLGETYILKARVETVAGGTQYDFKAWEQGTPEPSGWEQTILEDSGPDSGSILLIAHHMDVEFGNVDVTPLS